MRRQSITIALGQIRREDFRLSREATALAAVEVVGTAASVINASKMGASTTISDSALTPASDAESQLLRLRAAGPRKSPRRPATCRGAA
jgi:hypothetical protein